MTRANAKGSSKVIFLTAMPSDPLAPTGTELDAGVDLSCHISGVEGFEQDAQIDTAEDLCSLSDPQFVTSVSLGDAKIIMYWESDDTDSKAAYAALAAGTTGAIAILHDGKQVGEVSEVWPVLVATRHIASVQAMNEPKKVSVNFAITAVPTLDGVQAA